MKSGWSWSGSDVACGSGTNQLFIFTAIAGSTSPTDAFTDNVKGTVNGCSGSGGSGGSGGDNSFNYTLKASTTLGIEPADPVIIVGQSVELNARNYEGDGDISGYPLADAVDNWSSDPATDVVIATTTNGVTSATTEPTVWFRSSEPGTYKVKVVPYGGVASSGASVDVKNITVELEFQNSIMSNWKVIDPFEEDLDPIIGVIVGDEITFNAKLSQEITLDDSDFVWAGAGSGNGQTITITFDEDKRYALGLSVLGSENLVARIIADDVPAIRLTTWALLNSEAAEACITLGTEAQIWAVDNAEDLGGGLHNGRGDAARHAFWNVLICVEIDEWTANAFTSVWENEGLIAGNPHNETVMDLHNNRIGRSISDNLDVDREDCAEAVLQELNDGGLWILDDIENNNEIGLMIPSN